MIHYKTGNIFNSGVNALVNPVNCVGVSGKGLALQFKKNFPKNFLAYKQACDKNEVKVGDIFLYMDAQSILSIFYIFNFPTKLHWANPSKLEYIDQGLQSLNTYIRALKIKSIAIPALGCGLGGLNWNDVKELIDKNLSDLNDVEILVYEP